MIFNLQGPEMHTWPRFVPRESTSRKNKRKLKFWCVLWDMYILIHVHVAWIVLDTCTCGLDSFGYMYFSILLNIYVLLDTFGYICTFGYMYFWRHVHWHFTYKWMIHLTLYLFFGFHMFLCQSIVLICVDYLLLMNALCQNKKLLYL